eukprot:6169726-Prymnesium_polylepis.1
MPATAATAAAAAALQQARARPAVARAAQSGCRRVHVRAHKAIGTSAQPSNPSACCLPAGPSSS